MRNVCRDHRLIEHERLEWTEWSDWVPRTVFAMPIGSDIAAGIDRTSACSCTLQALRRRDCRPNGGYGLTTHSVADLAGSSLPHQVPPTHPTARTHLQA